MDKSNISSLDDKSFNSEQVLHSTKQSKLPLYFIVVVLILFLAYIFGLSAPSDFPLGAVVRIEQGMSLRNVSLLLYRSHIIRSRLLFEAFVIFYGGEKHIMYSDYLFESKLPVFQVARRIFKGEHHMAPIVVTIPEGFDNTQIGDTFAAKLANFNKNKFLSLAVGKEGYLFPDTYFFFTSDNEEDVLQSLTENFNDKIAQIHADIIKSGKSEKEIITMASIIEREAKGESDRGFISGILWKRLSMGMPLQVDAAPDTYKTLGLPESPICNPGLAAMKSAISPQNSPYLYYLHDKGGNIHYARSYSEHLINKLKYLP